MPPKTDMFVHEDAPPCGFTIRSDGSVLRSPDESSYTEDQVAKYYAMWIMMKKQGHFDNPTREGPAELEAPAETTGAAGSSQEPFKRQMVEEKGKNDMEPKPTSSTSSNNKKKRQNNGKGKK